MIDHSGQVRRAVIKLLKTTSGITALVGQRTHDQPPTNPVRPFIRYQRRDARPEDSSCGDGARVEFDLHIFTDTPGSEQCDNIAATVVSVLQAADLEVTGTIWELDVLGVRDFQDGNEVNARHGIVSVGITII